jgi:hypothetical protein
VPPDMSGVPPDMSGALEDSNSNSPPSGISRGTRAIIHRTVRCAPDMSGAPRKGGLRNSPASGFHSSRSAIIHRTVRCTPDCPVQQRSNGYFGANGYLHCIYCALCVRRSQACPYRRTGQETVDVRCPGGPTSQKLQRSESNDSDDVAGAPDCPVCTGLSGAPSNRQASQRPLLVVGAINTPTTPPFIVSKFSTSQLLQEL